MTNSKRDQQLYANDENVHQLVNYIQCSKVIYGLSTTQRLKPTRTIKLGLGNMMQSWSKQTDLTDSQCARQFNTWALESFSRDGWRKIKTAYTKVQSRQRLGIKPLYIQSPEMKRFLHLQAILQFDNASELLDYLLPDSNDAIWQQQTDDEK